MGMILQTTLIDDVNQIEAWTYIAGETDWRVGKCPHQCIPPEIVSLIFLVKALGRYDLGKYFHVVFQKILHR